MPNQRNMVSAVIFQSFCRNVLAVKQHLAFGWCIKSPQQGQQRCLARSGRTKNGVQFLADEPTGNLDEDTAMEITAVLKESAHTFGKCVVVVTHSGEVAKQADVVLEIKRGHLKERNTQ